MSNSRPSGARQIPCARCGKPTLFTPENPYRPFCSERCKLIDLGNWADGRYAIPVQNPAASGSENDHDEDANGDQRAQNADQSANRSSNPGDE